MKELHTEIEINASAEKVWNTLTDFDSFPLWNPFIRTASGKAAAVARLSVYLQPSGALGMRFSPKVLAAVPNRELRWLGRFLLPGLLDGEHSFIIEPFDTGRVRFFQSETFTGLLVPFFERMLNNSTLRGFKEMNEALKQRAEGFYAERR